MSKEVNFGAEVRSLIAEGVDLATRVLLKTLGPAGGCVAISESYGGVKDTKDGASAIESLEVSPGYKVNNREVGNYVNVGIHAVKSATSQMDLAVGDNTTTGGVLTGFMIKAVNEALSKRSLNARVLCTGLDWAKTEALKVLKEITVPVTSIGHVATIAANGDEEIGSMIADIHSKVGDAAVTVKLSNSINTTYEVVDGFEIDRGFISPYFATDNKNTCELENPYVLITDKKISSIQEILKLLQAVMQQGRALLIIAEDVDGDALAALVVNKIQRGLKVAAIKAPSFGEKRKALLQDIAVLTGATFFCDEMGMSLENTQLESLGQATSVKISRDKTCIINSQANKAVLERRCEQILNEVKNAANNYDRDTAQERFNKLKHGAAVLHVGGDSEAQAKTRKDLVEDAVKAARAAVKSGIVPGAGASYCYISNKVKQIADDLHKSSNCHKAWLEGVEIFVNSLKKIQHNIILNALHEISEVSIIEDRLDEQRTKANKCTIGYDARNNCISNNLIESGIIDASQGPENAITIAVDSAKRFASTEVCMVNLPTNDKDMGPAGLM